MIAAAGVRAATRRGVVISRGTRVYLRTMAPDDLVYLADWVDDPFIERMVGSELLRSFKHVYDKSPDFYEAVLTDATQVVLMIEATHGHSKPLGLTRLFNIHLFEGYAFLETLLADPRAMRRGYGVEAGKLISYYGMDVLGLRRLEAKVYEYNVLSMNALRRNGFTQEGVLRKAGFDGERYWDVLIFGVLRDEMEAQRTKDKYLPLEGAERNVIDSA